MEQTIDDTKQSFELIRTSLHDYKHNIISLTMLAENSDMEGIKEYLHRQNDLLGKSLFYYQTGNDTVDAILYIKQKIAEKSGIAFMINANIPDNCPISSEHFASILGNLLDNAIESSQKESEPFIEVKLNRKEDYFWIVVKNKCTAADVTLKTAKPDKLLHGIGLNSVKHTVSKYDGDISINTERDSFEVRIMIPIDEARPI